MLTANAARSDAGLNARGGTTTRDVSTEAKGTFGIEETEWLSGKAARKIESEQGHQLEFVSPNWWWPFPLARTDKCECSQQCLPHAFALPASLRSSKSTEARR